MEHERWMGVPDFPSYSVSTEGRVRNDKTDRILRTAPNQSDTEMVGLMRNNVQFKRSVALLVASAFVEKPRPTFDTPVNVNGHRHDCRAENLVWRPRWYAVLYNRQFREPWATPIVVPVRHLASRKIFPNSFAAAVHFGLLEKDICLSVFNNTYVWVTFDRFEIVE